MSYLTGQVTASAPALFVICRYLATRPSGATTSTIQSALAPPAFIAEMGRAGRTANVPPMLRDSLALGVDIGMLDVEGVGEQRLWALRKDYLKTIVEMPRSDSRGFRSLLLRRFGMRALQAVESGETPPDVPFALTWLMTLDPLQSMGADWEKGPSEALERAGMRSAVSNPEQWRPFLRWAQALGLVNLVYKTRLSVDSTRAIYAALPELPQQASASDWFDRLHTVLPLLGDPRLVKALPSGRVDVSSPSAATALALIKLERANRVRLIAADDAANAVVLRLGSWTKRVARIEVVEELA